MVNNEVQNSAAYRQRNPLRVHANPTSQPLLQAGEIPAARRRQSTKSKIPTDTAGWLLYLAALEPAVRQVKLGQLKRQDKEMHATVMDVLRKPSQSPAPAPVQQRLAATSKIGPEEPVSVEMTAAQPITSVNTDVADTSVVVTTAPAERKPDVATAPPTMVTPKKQRPPQPPNLAMMQASAGAMTGQANGNRAISPGSAR